MIGLLKHRLVGVLIGLTTLPLAIVSAEQDRALVGRPEIPALKLEVIDTKDPIPVGGTTTYLITAINQGSTPQTDMKVIATFEPETEYVSSGSPTRGTLHGKDIVEFSPLPQLTPKAKATWQVVLKAIAPGDLRFAVWLKSGQLRRPVRETEATTSYTVSGSTAAKPPATPAVRLEMSDIADPVPIGETVTYVIAATNQGSATQTNLKMVARLPSRAEYVCSDGVAPAVLKKIKGMDVVEYRPLPALSPKCKALWRVTVRAVKSGDVRFLVSMTSDQLGRPVKEEEATTFYLPPVK